jgi:hypothetical protein
VLVVLVLLLLLGFPSSVPAVSGVSKISSVARSISVARCGVCVGAWSGEAGGQSPRKSRASVRAAAVLRACGSRPPPEQP